MDQSDVVGGDAFLTELMQVITRGRTGSDEWRLPTERELSTELGISRGAVRERLTALEVLGFVRRTQGSGTYVQVPHSSSIQLYFTIALTLGHISFDQLEHAREMMERELVQEAARNATPDDIRILEECIRRMTSGSIDDGIEGDSEFHLHIVRMASNPIMSLMMEGLSTVMRDLLARRRQLANIAEDGTGGRRETDRVHEQIVDALRVNDPQKALLAMEEHFRVWNQIRRTHAEFMAVMSRNEKGAHPWE